MTVVLVLRLIMVLIEKRSCKRRDLNEKLIGAKPVENDELFDHLFINKSQNKMTRL